MSVAARNAIKLKECRFSYFVYTENIYVYSDLKEIPLKTNCLEHFPFEFR